MIYPSFFKFFIVRARDSCISFDTKKNPHVSNVLLLVLHLNLAHLSFESKQNFRSEEKVFQSKTLCGRQRQTKHYTVFLIL